MPADSTARPRRSRPLSAEGRAAEFLLSFGLGDDLRRLAAALASCEQAEHELTPEQAERAEREYFAAFAAAARSTYARRTES